MRNSRLYAFGWNYANWMYQNDETYRQIIDSERKLKEWREKALAADEARRDAFNPLMTKFTKKVIAALEARIAEVFNASVALKDRDPRQSFRLREQALSICSIRDKYRKRLEHFQRYDDYSTYDERLYVEDYSVLDS